MEHTNVISFYPNSARRVFRTAEMHSSVKSKQRIERWMQAAELMVTALIGAGFCFCIGLVVTML